MMQAQPKPYRGMAMEGLIASWYAKHTGRDRRRFETSARAVFTRVPAGGRVLEVAPGPGYLAIEIAKSGRRVSAVDISESFVRIARDNARAAGVDIDVRHGDAAALPFPDASFDFVVCMAAFKNFSNPVGALDEIHRVLVPGGRASIYDLRKDATADEIAAEVRNMHLSPANALFTRAVFRFSLLKRAYTRDALLDLAGASKFRGGQIVTSGIGFELMLVRER